MEDTFFGTAIWKQEEEEEELSMEAVQDLENCLLIVPFKANESLLVQIRTMCFSHLSLAFGTAQIAALSNIFYERGSYFYEQVILSRTAPHLLSQALKSPQLYWFGIVMQV